MSVQTAPKPEFTAEIHLMQDQLSDLIDLALLAKQAHWNVTGPTFQPLHLQLDELAALSHRFADEVAERINALGSWPNGQVRDVAEASKLPPLAAGALRDGELVDAMDHRLTALAQRTRNRIAKMSAEPANEDVLITLLQELEKQAWMLRVQRR